MSSHDRQRRASAEAPAARVRRPIQARLEVGPVDDPMEVEAEATADRVIAAIQTSGGPQAMAARVDSISRMSGPEEEELPTQGSRIARMEEEEPLQGSRIARSSVIGAEGGAVDAELEARLTAGSGSPLPEPVRATMEGAFGADFSAVRVSENPAAADIGARAYTTGSDIRFAPGQFKPESSDGQHLLAHELTHVVQQGAATARSTVRRSVIDQAALSDQEKAEIDGRVCHDSVAYVLKKLGKDVDGHALQDLGGTVVGNAAAAGAIPDGAVVNFMRRDYNAKSEADLFIASKHTMLSVGGGKGWATNNGCFGGSPKWSESAFNDFVDWVTDGEGETKAYPKGVPHLPSTEVMIVFGMP
ncbi:MAG: DUF4157 domain-containing protein [Acidimicrobiales bacterium]